ncbi:MAG: response regulator transcription factor [Pirellulales bacterium]
MKYLIVDDDRLCREMLRDVLSRYGRCHVVFNGTEALGAVRLSLEDNLPYDLICLDIMMPRMDGHEVLQSIRQIEMEYGIRGLAGAKVIMTTALADSKHCLRAFREGCESYITKPVDEAELLEKMRQLGVAVPEVVS